MQNRAVDEAGNVWELDANGEPVRMVTPAAGGRVFSLPPNPKDVRAEARAAEDQQMQRDNAIRAERAADRADKTAQRQAAAAELAAGAAAKPTEFQSKSAGFLGRMMQAERDFSTVPEAERGGRSVPRQAFHNIAPGIENTFVNSADRQKADQAVENFIAASLRQESGASISPMEFERQYKIFFPAPGDTPEVLAQKANARRQAIEGFRIAAGPLADAAAGTAQQQADNEVPDPTTGADLKPPPSDNGPDDLPPENDGEVTAATGKTSSKLDPRMSAQVDAMVNAGASLGMINAVLTKQKLRPLAPASFNKAKEWMRDNPGKRYFGANISRDEDLNLGQRVLANPSVAPVAAGLANYANTATAGIPAALAGPEGQGALDAASALHPDASVFGNVAGGVTGALGMEAGIAARAPAALAKYAPRIADTLYGGLLGFNQAQEGEGLQGAALGAGAGLAGGVLGEKVMRGVGSVARGVTNPAVRALREADVPMTVGQIVGNGGMIGRGVKKVEDALTSVPFVGNMVDARRREGVEAFADKMANDAVAPIGGYSEGYGQGTVDDLLQQGSDAYTRATAGAHVPLDEQFPTDMADVRMLGSLLPEDLGARFGKAVDNRVKPIEDAGFMSGDSFQQAVRGLKSYRAEAPKPGFEQDYRDALSQGIDALRGQMTRGGGADVVENLGKADEAWKAIKIFEKATEAARNGARSGEVGLPMPSQFNDAATAAAKKYGGPRFNADLIDAGQSVLPSKIADSGTWTRALVGGGGIAGLGTLGGLNGGVQGAASGTGTGLGVALLLAAGGSKAGQAAMRKALLDRPELAVEIGNALTKNAGVGGWTGAGVLAPLLVGN